MTYQELVSKLKDTYQEKDASKISEHLAIQFNIQGEAEGALYLEIANGQLHIEPYEYYDRDILVTTSAADLLALAQGSLDILEAYQSGKISAEGNLAKALLLNEIHPKLRHQRNLLLWKLRHQRNLLLWKLRHQLNLLLWKLRHQLNLLLRKLRHRKNPLRKKLRLQHHPSGYHACPARKTEKDINNL